LHTPPVAFSALIPVLVVGHLVVDGWEFKVKSAIIILAIGVLLFELIEHIVFPLIWFIKDRKRRSVCGLTGMAGKIGEIKYWQDSEGQIFVNGELWRAVSDFQLSAGDRVVVQDVYGLTVSVIPFKENDG
jgi:membrane-bound ClpP family serine protease